MIQFTKDEVALSNLKPETKSNYPITTRPTEELNLFGRKWKLYGTFWNLLKIFNLIELN